MAVKFLNNFETTLTAGITSGSVTLNVADGSPLSAITFGGTNTIDLTLQNGDDIEIVSATANPTANTITVTRGQDGTTALSFPVGTTVSNRLTRQRLQTLQEGVEAGGGGAPELQFTLYDGTAISVASGLLNHTMTGDDVIEVRPDEDQSVTFKLRFPAVPGTGVYRAVVIFKQQVATGSATFRVDVAAPVALTDDLFYNVPGSVAFPDSVSWSANVVIYTCYVFVAGGVAKGVVERRSVTP